MMKLFIQDHGWAGATIVVAESSEKAKEFLMKNRHPTDYYEPDRPWDVEQEIGVEPITYEVYGDR